MCSEILASILITVFSNVFKLSLVAKICEFYSKPSHLLLSSAWAKRKKNTLSLEHMQSYILFSQSEMKPSDIVLDNSSFNNILPWNIHKIELQLFWGSWIYQIVASILHHKNVFSNKEIMWKVFVNCPTSQLWILCEWAIFWRMSLFIKTFLFYSYRKTV